MELVPMTPQPQNVTAFMPGMAAAGNAPSGQGRLSVAPLLFAALLQELQPLPAGGEPAELAVNPVPGAKDALPGKAKAGTLPAAGVTDERDAVVDQPSDQLGSPLAQLLAMVGQPVAGQSRLLSAGQAANPADGLKEGEEDKSPATLGEEAGASGSLPLALDNGSLQSPAAQGFGMSYLNGPPPLEGTAAAAQMPELTGAVQPADVRPTGSAAVPAAGDRTATLPQLFPAAPLSAPPAGKATVQEKTAGPDITRETGNPRLRIHPADSGGADSLAAPESLQAEKPAQTLAASASPERGPAQGQGNKSKYDGVQLPAAPAADMPFAAKVPTGAVPQGEAPAEPAAILASRTPAMAAHATHFGPLPLVPQGGEPLPAPGASAAAGSLAGLQVEVLFTDPSAKGQSSGRNGQRDSGAKEQEQQSPAGLGVPAARTADAPDVNRVAPQPKVDGQRNALHESIMNQVTASVVSHDGQGNGSITIKLSPDDLGELQINLRIENQQVKVEIITDNRTVRDALMGNLDHLRETLLKQNLNMERFDVSSGGGHGFGQGFREERGDQRRVSALPFGHDTGPFDSAREQGEDDWGGTETSLVNLRL